MTNVAPYMEIAGMPQVGVSGSRPAVYAKRACGSNSLQSFTMELVLYKYLVVGCGLWVVGRGSWVVGCGLWVVGGRGGNTSIRIFCFTQGYLGRTNAVYYLNISI